MNAKKRRREDICRYLVEALKLTDKCKDIYQMAYMESQDSVIAYFNGRKIVRIWLDGEDDEMGMIKKIIDKLYKPE